MSPYLLFIIDYLNGKPIYPFARRVISLLFSIGLTSFLFEKFYFKYDWMDISDYKGILDFAVKGYFFVPFCIFIIVHYLLDWISYGAFVLITSIKSGKIYKKIYKINFRKGDARKILKIVNKNPFFPLPEKIKEPDLYILYEYLAQNISLEKWVEVEQDIAKQKVLFRNNFQLTLKAIFTITAYFFIVPYFGWKLYLLVIIVLTVILFILYWAFLVIDVIPMAMRKLDSEVKSYIEKSKQSLPVETTVNNDFRQPNFPPS